MRFDDHNWENSLRPIDPIPLGSFTLLERLGNGGLAEAFISRTTEPSDEKKLVVIKRILPEVSQDEEVLNILFTESEKASELTHKSLCSCVKLNEIEGVYFLISEYVWGQNLARIFDYLQSQDQPTSFGLALYIMTKICEGLEYIHQLDNGIVHYDLIPENLCISYEGHIKILDVGIGKAVHFLLHGRTRILKRKYAYMSPELVRGHHIDHRSDIFSFGALFYELLTGVRPFEGDNDFSTLDNVRKASAPKPSHYRSEIPEDLDKLVTRCLARDPDDRWQKTSELCQAVRDCSTLFDQSFSTSDVSEWIKEAFAEKMNEQKTRLDEYRQAG